MAWFLLTWDPHAWTGISDDAWNAFAGGADSCLAEGPWCTGDHDCGIVPGDGILFVRQGRGAGLLALGEVTSESYEGQHPDDPHRTGHYVDFAFTEVRRIEGRIPTETLVDEVPGIAWDASTDCAARVPDPQVEAILRLWRASTDGSTPARVVRENPRRYPPVR